MKNDDSPPVLVINDSDSESEDSFIEISMKNAVVEDRETQHAEGGDLNKQYIPSEEGHTEDSNNTNTTYLSSDGKNTTRRKNTRYLSEDQTMLRKSDVVGVSVHWLKFGFLDEVRKSGFRESATIYEIEDLSKIKHGIIRKKGARIACPIDGKLGAAYIDCIHGKDCIGPANIMLSYSWGNTVGEIIHTLDDFCQRNRVDPRRTYVWICCLCYNQHRVADNKQKGIEVPLNGNGARDIHLERIKSIGHTVALMSPWTNPVALSRTSCMFELHTSHESEHCRLTFAMPPREKKDMVETLDRADLLYEALARTKIQDLKTSKSTDKTSILDYVNREYGLKIFNNCLNQLLRHWIREEILEALKAYEGIGGAPLHSRTISAFKSWVQDVKTLKNGCGLGELLQSCEGGVNTYSFDADYANLCSKVGSTLARNGENDEAINLFRKTLAIDEEALGAYHPDSAATLNNLGAMLEVKGDYDGALVEYRKALAIDKKVFGEYHPHTATSRQNIGAALCDMGNYEGALEEYYKALNIREDVLGVDHPDTAIARNNIGSALYRKEDYSGALLEFHKALKTCEKLLGKDHAYSKSLVQKICHIQDHMERSDEWQVTFSNECMWQIQAVVSSMSGESQAMATGASFG